MPFEVTKNQIDKNKRNRINQKKPFQMAPRSAITNFGETIAHQTEK